MKEFLSYIFGQGSMPLLAACLFFAYLAALLWFSRDVKKRDISSNHTPEQFSWKFLYLDNLVRIWGNVTLIFLAVRFLRPWIFPVVFLPDGTAEEVNEEWQLIGSGVLGLLSDMFWLWLKKLRILANDKVREKFKQAGLKEEENV